MWRHMATEQTLRSRHYKNIPGVNIKIFNETSDIDRRVAAEWRE